MYFLVKLSNSTPEHVKNYTITVSQKNKNKNKYLETINATGLKIILTKTNEEIKYYSAIHKIFLPN